MNFIQTIIKNKEEIGDLNEKNLINKIKEGVNLLNQIQLSIVGKDPNETITTSIIDCISRIIIFYDELLSNKLKKIKSDDNLGVTCFFRYLNKYFFNMESVKYTQNNNEIEYDKKSYLWILLVILDKEFYEFFKDLYKKDFDKQIYCSDSIVVNQKEEILEITKILEQSKIPLKFNLFEDYIAYKLRTQITSEEKDVDYFFKNNFERKISKISIEQKTSNTNNTKSLFHSTSLFGVTNPSFRQNRLPSNFINNDDEEINNFLFYDQNKEVEEIKIVNSNIQNEEIKNENNDDKEFVVDRKIDMLIKENFFYVKREFLEEKHNVKTNINIFNLNFEFRQRNDFNRYTNLDIITLNSKNIKVTNSLVFYLNHYYKKQQYYRFINKSPENNNTIDNENFQCFNCLEQFTIKITPPYDKIYWCSYYMRFVCDGCFKDDYCVIPYFVLKKWDFSKYSISIKAKEILEKFYSEPIIKIKSNDILIQKSSVFKKVLYYKRKIHKIYDIMKCNKAEEFALNVLKEHKYLVLLENLFSLKDLMEMEKGIFLDKIKIYFENFEKHIIKECKTCEYKGGYCNNCNTNEKLFCYQIEIVQLCKICGNIYHRKCSLVHICNLDS